MENVTPTIAIGTRRKIFLVEDHAVVRQGLAAMINSETDLAVCGEAATIVEALSRVAESGADIAVVDLSLGDGSGLDLIRKLSSQAPQVPVLVLSMHDEKVHGPRALVAGARGYIMKHEATDRVLEGIRTVLAGGKFITEAVSQRIHEGAEGQVTLPVARLSDREFQIYQLIGQGVGPGEMAKRLGLSVKTVETHREHIKSKLGLTNGRELVRHAMQYGMDKPSVAAADLGTTE